MVLPKLNRTLFSVSFFRTPLACLGQSNKAAALPSGLQTTSGSSVFQDGNYQVLSFRSRPNLLNGHGFSCRLATAHMWMGTHQGLCRGRLQGKATSAGHLPLSSLLTLPTPPHPSQRGLAVTPQSNHGPRGLLRQRVGPWLKGRRRPRQCSYTTSLRLGRTLKTTCSLQSQV